MAMREIMSWMEVVATIDCVKRAVKRLLESEYSGNANYAGGSGGRRRKIASELTRVDGRGGL